MSQSSTSRPDAVEYKARFDESTYQRLTDQLGRDAQDVGSDDRTLHYFPLPDSLLTVTRNHSTATAAISYVSRGPHPTVLSFDIPPASVDGAVETFTALGLARSYHVEDNRQHNYRLAGAEVVLKWSPTWGFHAIITMALPPQSSQSAIAATTRKIRDLADDLGIKLMLPSELAAFERAAEARLRNKR